MKWIALLWLAVATTFAHAERLTAKSACTDLERWTFGDTITERMRDEFDGFITHRKSPVRGFSQAMALRRQSTANNEIKMLAEYWVSRALYEAKLYHIAYNGFSMVAGYPVSEKTAGVQAAALECINHIYSSFPSMGINQASALRLGDLQPQMTTDAEKSAYQEFAFNWLKQQLSEDSFHAKTKIDYTKNLSYLKGAGPLEDFGKALVGARNNDHRETIASLQKFFTASSQPKSVQRHLDQAHILLARALFSVHRYDDAAAELKHVKKSSNELAQTLSELSWAYLQDEKYDDSIGTALNFQAGGLRNTFAPEAPMVMAMALNEICQFPDSLRAVGTFRKLYEKPYRWLEQWNQASNDQPIYPMAVKFMKKQTDLPVRIGTEWVRSPIFISHQEEVNLLIDERDSAKNMGRMGAKEERTLALEIQTKWAELKGRIQKVRAGSQTRVELPHTIITDLEKLKYEITTFRRLFHAAPAWRTILANHENHSPVLEKKLIAEINSDLADRTRSMYVSLQEIAENNQLIEVEIYNGASQDIIFQNAHPEYKQIAQDMKEQAEKGNSDKTWDWGRTPAGSGEESAEIWEDELGSFKADLVDNCSSKDKYLAIKKGH